MQQNKKQAAAIYVRVSTEEQAAEGQSISAQIETLTQYCRAFGMEIYKIYSDAGFSGKETKNRPGLNELIRDSSKKLFHIVLVWKISRLSRNLKDLLYIIDVFENNNVSFSSYSEKFDTSTPVGKMTLQLLGSIAEFERNTIVENVKLGLREYARKGGKTGTVLGYDSINRQLVVNQAEAQLVRLIFDLYTRKRLKLSAIASYLNARGLRTKRGASFRSDSVAVILDNPVYIGINRHNTSSENAYTTKGSHEPIVETAVWEKAQALRKAAAPRRSTKPQTALLSGLIACPVCQSSMNIFYTKSRKKLYRYYKCSSKGCAARLVNADNIESDILGILSLVAANAEIKKDVSAAASGIDVSRVLQDEKELDMELTRQQAVLSRYLNLFETGKMENEGMILERINSINTRIKALERKKTCLLNKTCLSNKIDLHSGQRNTPDHDPKEPSLSEVLDKAGPADKRHLIECLINRIHIKKDGEIESIQTLFPIIFVPKSSGEIPG